MTWSARPAVARRSRRRRRAGALRGRVAPRWCTALRRAARTGSPRRRGAGSPARAATPAPTARSRARPMPAAPVPGAGRPHRPGFIAPTLGGQPLAEVADQVRFGPGGLGLLDSCDRLRSQAARVRGAPAMVTHRAQPGPVSARAAGSRPISPASGRERYPAIIRLCGERLGRTRLVPFLRPGDKDGDLHDQRESINARLRRAVNARGHFLSASRPPSSACTWRS